MLCLTALQARYTPFKPSNSEEFSSASRSVKPGLIASGIVSAWTWAATLVSDTSILFHVTPEPRELGRFVAAIADLGQLFSQLQSSAVAYKYGISGPWWYGAGATIQVLLFAQV